MTTEQFHQFVSRKPFRPMRITLRSGEAFSVEHPENLARANDWALASTAEGMTVFPVEEVSSITYLTGARAKKR